MKCLEIEIIKLRRLSNHQSNTVEPLNNRQSGATEIVLYREVSLFRGHLIHKVLWWDSNKCPLQRGELYSEVI